MSHLQFDENWSPTLDEFFNHVMSRFGWEPTPWRLAVFREWARQEGITTGVGDARLEYHWNPLATTRRSETAPRDESKRGGNWNSIGVGIYLHAQAGINATVETLALSYYDNVRRCFEDQTGYQAAIGPKDFTTWVGHAAYGAYLVNFMNTVMASKTMAPTSGVVDEEARQRIDAMNEAMQLRFKIWSIGNHPEVSLLREAVRVLTEGGIIT